MPEPGIEPPADRVQHAAYGSWLHLHKGNVL